MDYLSQRYRNLESLIRYPFKLFYNRVYRIYTGGLLIDTLQSRVGKTDEFFPEEWIGSVTYARNAGRECIIEEGLSKIVMDNGEIFSLKEIIELFPDEILGEKHIKKYGKHTGVLVKLLDSRIRLPLQCHPDRNFAQKHLNSFYGKTECWIILNTRKFDDEEPYIVLGFKEKVKKAEFKSFIKEQNINALLESSNHIPVKPGEVYFIESGLIHAIGEGLFLVEIQEPTDFTFSIERKVGDIHLSEDEAFCGLSIDNIASSFKFRPFGDEVISKFKLSLKLVESTENFESYILVGNETTSYFGANLFIIKDMITLEGEKRFSINIVVDGEGEIKSDDKKIRLLRGESFIIPYCASGFEIKKIGNDNLRIISCFVP